MEMVVFVLDFCRISRSKPDDRAYFDCDISTKVRT